MGEVVAAAAVVGVGPVAPEAAALQAQVALARVPVVAAVLDQAVAAVAEPRVRLVAPVDVPFVDGSRSAQSAKNLNRCRRHHSVVCRSRAETAQRQSVCVTVQL